MICVGDVEGSTFGHRARPASRRTVPAEAGPEPTRTADAFKWQGMARFGGKEAQKKRVLSLPGIVGLCSGAWWKKGNLKVAAQCSTSSPTVQGDCAGEGMIASRTA